MTFEWNHRTITIFEGTKNAPLVVMHENEHEGTRLWDLLTAQHASCTLAAVSEIHWEHDLAPWDAPAAFKRADPFTGGAPAYLHELTDGILPAIEEKLQTSFPKIYIAGYSLAGLFAMYSTTMTDRFDGFVSASGSMWFPGFVDYVKEHPVSSHVKRAYFSIGDTESKTKNPIMQPVEQNTILLEQMLAMQGIETTFVRNKGGHFVNPDLRLADGIAWILSAADEGSLHMNAIGTTEIHTERLTLRRFRSDDVKAAYENYGSDPKVNTYISFAPCTTIESTEQFLAMHLEQYASNPSFYGWAVTLDDVVIGSIGLFNVDDDSQQCELGYSIGSKWWGKGFATEAASAVLQFGFSQMGAHRIYASHHIDNLASGKVLQKIGMLYEGTLRDGQKNPDGSFSDLKLYAKLCTD